MDQSGPARSRPATRSARSKGSANKSKGGANKSKGGANKNKPVDQDSENDEELEEKDQDSHFWDGLISAAYRSRRTRGDWPRD